MRTAMARLREVIQTQGRFCALRRPRSHFFVTPKAGEKMDKHRLTQVGRGMKKLWEQMIPAYSPQARSRSERNFGARQGRLPQEIRPAGKKTSEQANRFLRERCVQEFNRKFAVPVVEKGTAFLACPSPRAHLPAESENEGGTVVACAKVLRGCALQQVYKIVK
jgi:hypothetical protein